MLNSSTEAKPTNKLSGNKTVPVSPSSGTAKAAKAPGANAGKKTDMIDKQKQAEKLRALIKRQQ